MLTLANDHLSVTLLDPNADHERFGTRYCTAGYIFQIDDPRHGPLLSGPTYPDSFNTFDGQGIPDAFNRSPLRAADLKDPKALVPGIGVCDLEADTVLDFLKWDVHQTDRAARFAAHHIFERVDFHLERTLSLNGRTVRSHTRLMNPGKAPVPLRWFPHPFYPQTTTDALCKFNIPVTLRESDGYIMGADGFIHRCNWPWKTDYYLALDHDARENLVVLQRHPSVGMVTATCSYVPALFPIWGNTRTFSFEPYLERTVSGGQSFQWWIDYDF